MPLWFHRQKAVFFAHVPKTGGSSIEAYLVERLGEPTIVWSPEIQRGGTGLITPPVHFSRADLTMFLPDALDFCFAFVRDPLERLLSEYRYQQGVSRSSRLRFSTWLHLVIESARLEPRIYDNHIRPQVDLIPSGAEIFRLENGFSAFVDRLDSVLDESAPSMDIPELNRRPHRQIDITRQDLRLIERYYEKDYERLQYARRNPDDHGHDPFAAVRSAIGRAIAPILVERQRRQWVR